MFLVDNLIIIILKANKININKEGCIISEFLITSEILSNKNDNFSKY